MIFFVGDDAGIRLYLSCWGIPIAHRITMISYERLMRQKMLVPGTYVFQDIDHLSHQESEQVAVIWERLQIGGSRLLNHPTRSMKRYEFLRALKERGSNRFGVYRPTEARRPASFPVFIREADEHTGSMTRLLHTPEDLEATIQDMFDKGSCRENKLIVEFCETADSEGVYRKYAAFCLGDRIIPAHLSFSKAWVTKASDTLTDKRLQEELQYVQTNPHEEELRKLFAIASIQYGRIDYGICDGALQIWEINTNPHIIPPEPKSPRREVFEYSAACLNAALTEIDSPVQGRVRVPNPGRVPWLFRRRRTILHSCLRSLGLLRWESALISHFSFGLDAARKLASRLSRV